VTLIRPPTNGSSAAGDVYELLHAAFCCKQFPNSRRW